MPKSSEQPTRNSTSSSSVAPLKPSARARPLPMASPSAPPGASGSVAGIRHSRIDSSAALASSTSPKPSTPSANG